MSDIIFIILGGFVLGPLLGLLQAFCEGHVADQVAQDPQGSDDPLPENGDASQD